MSKQVPLPKDLRREVAAELARHLAAGVGPTLDKLGDPAAGPGRERLAAALSIIGAVAEHGVPFVDADKACDDCGSPKRDASAEVKRQTGGEKAEPLKGMTVNWEKVISPGWYAMGEAVGRPSVVIHTDADGRPQYVVCPPSLDVQIVKPTA